MYLVYKTTNKINGLIYIGVHYSTSSIFDGYLGSGLHLKRAINFYGKEKFERVTLFTFDNKEDAYEMEARIVNEDFTQRCDNYNIRIGGIGAPSGESHHMFGKSHTEEAKKKISDHWMEGNHPKGMKGKKHTEDTKFKMSIAQKGKDVSEHTKQLLSEINKGKIISEESKKKMSEAKKGKFTGKDSPLYGKPLPESTKEKISKSKKGKKMSDSFKKAVSERVKGRNNPNSKYLWITPEGVFESAYTAADYYNIDRKTVEQRCWKGFSGHRNRKGELWSSLGWNVEAVN